ncbi:odorant receptor 45a-like [Calliphora vicina]|uniref:odorant receptor 45a-like n=1 Tax=Calliphora vicina TaxID=7373 RepID=UPI00325C0B07
MKLIRHIWQWNENANEEEFRIIDKISCKCVLMSRLYYMSVGAAAVSGVSRPIVIKLLKLWQGVEGDLEVPHKASFLWSTSTPLGYIAAFIWNLITVNFLVNASVAIDTLFLWLVANILIRFCILKERFKKAAQQTLPIITHELIIKNIKSHTQILNLAKELDSIFGEIIFLKSLVSCSQICFLVYRFMGKETSVATLNYPFVFLVAVVMQLFLYCFSGQLVKEQSLTVSTCIFENFNWSDLPVNCQKMLQMIMLRSQKCSNIKGIFFNLNLSLYLWFFKTAGSLLAVLKTFEADV